MKNTFLIITSNDYDDGKKTPKKFDIYEDKDKLEDNYILLGTKKNLIKKKNILEQWNFENKLFNASLNNNNYDFNKGKNNINCLNNNEKNDSQSTKNSDNKNNQINEKNLNKKQFILNEIKHFNFDEDIYTLKLNPNFKIHLNNH